MQHITLDRSSRSITISDEAYAQIEKLVEENMVCASCDKAYTEDNPNVLMNKCLDCLLATGDGTKVTYVGKGELTTYGQQHKLIDGNGFIYLSSTFGTRPEKSEYQTILHHGFSVPQSYECKGETTVLDSYYWRVYGDLTKSAVIIENSIKYSSTTSVSFLAYRDGTYSQVSKKKGEMKYLLERARNIAESTQDEYGAYHINGYDSYTLTDWHLYPIVADIASVEFDILASLKEAA